MHTFALTIWLNQLVDNMENEINTEQRILEAAENVFLEEGFAGARMQHIADKAGINKAMLHYYFRSKDKLFELVFQYKMQQFIPQITATLHDDSIPFFDKIDRFVMAYLGMLRKNPSLPAFIISTLNRNPKLAETIKIKIGKEVAQLIQSEIAKGTIKPVDPDQFLITLVGMCIFPFLARPLFSASFDLEPESYDRILSERHIHVMQFARSILTLH